MFPENFSGKIEAKKVTGEREPIIKKEVPQISNNLLQHLADKG